MQSIANAAAAAVHGGSSSGDSSSGEGWMNEADIKYIFISRIFDFLLHFSVH